MARKQTNPKEKYWANYYAKATHTTETVHIYTWTCPDCETVNRTRVNPANKFSLYKLTCQVDGRCGRCHGNVRQLTDDAGLTCDPTTPDA